MLNRKSSLLLKFSSMASISKTCACAVENYCQETFINYTIGLSPSFPFVSVIFALDCKKRFIYDMSEEVKPERDIEAGVEHDNPSCSADEEKNTLSKSSNVPVEDSAVQKEDTETEVKSSDAKEEQKELETGEKTSDDTSTVSGSISGDVPSVDNLEAGTRPSPPVSRLRRCMGCGPMEAFIRFLLYLVTVTFIVYLLYSFFDPRTPDHQYGQIVVGVLIGLILLFILIALHFKDRGYDFLWPWNQVRGCLERSSSISEARRNSNSREGDIESQITNQDESEMTAPQQEQEKGVTDKNAPQPCNIQNVPSTSSGERIVLKSMERDSCSVTKISEVASAVSSIVSDSLGQVTPSMPQTPSETKAEHVDEMSDKEVKSSDSEIMSSGEIRRRKFKNVEQCTVSSSSDEEAVKKD